MRSRLLAALVCALAVTAGCSGVFGGGSRTPTETLTPVPVPSVEPSPAPGVPAEAARPARPEFDVEALLAADRRVRARSSYRFRRVAVVDGPEGTVRLRRVREVGVDGGVYERLTVNGSGQVGTVLERAELWGNGTALRSRMEFIDGRVYVGRPTSDTDSPFGLGLDLPAAILFEADVVVRERADGQVVLASTEPFAVPHSLVPLATTLPRNASARLTVSERGVVRSVQLTYETRAAESVVTVAISQRVTAVNATTVRRPAWLENTPRADHPGRP